jgi:uncharacterized membrane protein YfcA
VSPLDFGLIVLAGIGGGLIGSVAGLASLVSYPALLAAGLGSVVANQSNTVALVFSSFGSIAGSRVELHDQWRRLARLSVVAVFGGAAGAALLLATPPGAFTKIVPGLIAVASLAILLPRRPVLRSTHHDGVLLSGAIFLIGAYGGYFGAAAGVMTLALLLRWTGDTLARSNAAKNVILGGANCIAALGFIALGSVRWLYVVPLAIGCLIGGAIGPVIVRRSPPAALRVVIAIAGLGLAIYLAMQAYG